MKFRYNVLKIKGALLLMLILSGCGNDSKKEKNGKTAKDFFEGEIIQNESVGLYGKLAGRQTTWLLSENRLKREQTYSGLANVLPAKAGIIVDLSIDSVTLYYSDVSGSFKYSGSCRDYQTFMKEKGIDRKGLDIMDFTFTELRSYQIAKRVKDSLKIKTFLCDYYLYKESPLKQELFDAKELNIKRSLLEMAILNLPAEITFPMQSEIKTMVAEVKNDSILNGSVTQALKEKVKNLLGNTSKGNGQTPSQQKQSQNRYAEKGINLIKKGIDAVIHLSITAKEVIHRTITTKEWRLPDADYKVLEDPDSFFEALPEVRETEIDD